MDEKLGENCGVSGVYLFKPLTEFPLGGATAFVYHMVRDQENRGQESVGIGYYNESALDGENSELMQVRKGAGRTEEVFGKLGSDINLEFLLNCVGNIAIGHDRYTTSVRGGKSKEKIERLISKGVIKTTINIERAQINLENKVIELQAAPFFRHHNRRHKMFMFVWNGNLVNFEELSADLKSHGNNYILETNTDTEIIKLLLTKELKAFEKPLEAEDIVSIFGNIAQKIKGAYTLIYVDGNGNFAFLRDPHGFKPACYGIEKADDGSPKLFACASETSAICNPVVGVSGREYKNLERGEIIVINDKKIHSPMIYTPKKRSAMCIFELIYFAKAKSKVYGIDVHLARRRLGAALARKETLVMGPNTLVTYTPQTPLPAAEGYIAEMANIRFNKIMQYLEKHPDRNLSDAKMDILKILAYNNPTLIELLIKDPSPIRTFLTSDIGKIKELVDNKHYVTDIAEYIAPSVSVMEALDLNPESLRDKNLVNLEDSIVRGNTSRGTIDKVRHHGRIRSIHMRVHSAPIIAPCFYGIDIPTCNELIACWHNADPFLIARALNLDSLIYLTPEEQADAVIENTSYHREDFCNACFTGHYPEEFGQKKYDNMISEFKAR